MILEKEITYLTDFGDVVVNLKEQMDKKGISINMMSRLSNVKYEIVKKYYYGENYGVTREIVAKFCYILDCEVDDILIYKPPEKKSLKRVCREFEKSLKITI